MVISSIREMGNIGYLIDAFSVGPGLFFRPVGKLFFQLIYSLFGLNPSGFHLVFLLTHFVNSMLVVLIASKISDDLFLSWTTGFLYATALKIHIDPMLWMVGFYDIGGALFFFTAVIFFIRKKLIFSSVSCGLALFTKEPTIILLPLLFLLGIFKGEAGTPLREKILNAARNLRWHAAVITIYLILRMPYPGVATLDGGNPYDLELTVSKLLGNLATYTGWTIEAVNPYISAGNGVVYIVLLSVLLFYLLRRKSASSLILLLGSWVILTLLPVLFLSTHLFRYYLTYSLPASLLLMALMVRELLNIVVKNAKVVRGILVAASVCCVISGSYYFTDLDHQGYDIPTMEGSGNLIRKGTIVNMTHDFLLENYPALPEGSTILFNWIPTISFGREIGPRIWYRKDSIHVFELQQLARDSAGIYVRDRLPEGGRRPYLESASIIFLAFHGDYLRRVPADAFFDK